MASLASWVPKSKKRRGAEEKRAEGGNMAKLLKKAGDFVLDIAAAQYKRSMTRKLNAFGEQFAKTRAERQSESRHIDADIPSKVLPRTHVENQIC